MNNLFLFTGEETFMLQQQIKSWKKAFIKKYEGDFNLNTIDGTVTEVGDLISQIEAAPFLGDKRLIFVEGLPEAPKTRNADKVTKKDEARDEELKKLADYLEKITETSVVVFVQPNPDKRKSLYKKIVHLSTPQSSAQDDKAVRATIKEFAPLSGPVLNSWVQKQAKSHGATIDINNTEYLISQTGQNLWRINQELQKLSSYCQGKPIDRPCIDHLVVPTVEANVFHLTDALGAKDHKKAIHNLHKTMAAGENLRQTFYMIVRQFRLLLQVGGYLESYPNTSPNSVATSLKLHPFVARNTVSQLKHFKTDELKAAYQRLLEIDVALKTSKIRVTTDNQDELALAIERFIMKFCS